MGFWSSLGSAVSSFCSSVCSGIKSVCSSIGSGVSKLASEVIKPIVKIPEIDFKRVIEFIVDVACTIAEALGLKDKEESAEEIGLKAEEAEKQGIKPENFDSYTEYIENIRNNIEVDKSKIDSLSDIDRAKYRVTGSIILMKGIEEKEGIEMSAEFIQEIGKQELKADEVREYIKTFKEEGLELKDFSRYFKGTLENNKFENVGNTIEGAIKNLNPNMTSDEIDDKMSEMSEKAKLF